MNPNRAERRRAEKESAKLRRKIGLVMLTGENDPARIAADHTATLAGIERLIAGRHAAGVLSALGIAQARILATTSDDRRHLERLIALARDGIADIARHAFAERERIAEDGAA